MTKEELLEEYGDLLGDVQLVTVDGYDDAILGIDSKSLRVIYDVDEMVEILMETENMEEDEAL